FEKITAKRKRPRFQSRSLPQRFNHAAKWWAGASDGRRLEKVIRCRDTWLARLAQAKLRGSYESATGCRDFTDCCLAIVCAATTERCQIEGRCTKGRKHDSRG